LVQSKKAGIEAPISGQGWRLRYWQAMSQPTTITLDSHWRGKRTPVEVVVTRVTVREVSYIAVDCSVSGTLPQRLFLQDFQPVPVRKKKR
jgi:hypothetical protein